MSVSLPWLGAPGSGFDTLQILLSLCMGQQQRGCVLGVGRSSGTGGGASTFIRFSRLRGDGRDNVSFVLARVLSSAGLPPGSTMMRPGGWGAASGVDTVLCR